jgi:hypothetical protein
MTQEVGESGGSIRPRPLRIVMIALLAAAALTLAYPMSARKGARPGTEGSATTTTATAVARPAASEDPQLAFSMRTVVRPSTVAESHSERQKAVHVPESLPQFEGYVARPAHD